jgi:hypothetical protein
LPTISPRKIFAIFSTVVSLLCGHSMTHERLREDVTIRETAWASSRIAPTVRNFGCRFDPWLQLACPSDVAFLSLHRCLLSLPRARGWLVWLRRAPC